MRGSGPCDGSSNLPGATPSPRLSARSSGLGCVGSPRVGTKTSSPSRGWPAGCWVALRLRTRTLSRQYFAVFLAASVLPVLLAGTVAIFSVQEALASRTGQDNEILAQGAASLVEERMREISSHAENAAGDNLL